MRYFSIYYRLILLYYYVLLSSNQIEIEHYYILVSINNITTIDVYSQQSDKKNKTKREIVLKKFKIISNWVIVQMIANPV